MAAIFLPPTFSNSFWSQDHFRRGLTVLFDKLEAGCVENDHILAYIQAQAVVYRSTAASISAIPPSSAFSSTGFSLHQSFLTLHDLNTEKQAEAYDATARALERQIIDGFRQWSKQHAGRVRFAREELIGLRNKAGKIVDADQTLVGTYEELSTKVDNLRQVYTSKSRSLDDMEEDARFAPIASPPTAVKQVQMPTEATPMASPSIKRSGTVSERIAEKLKVTPAGGSPVKAAPSTPVEKHHQRSNSMAEKELFQFSGVAIPFEGLISLLTRFAHHLKTTLPPDVDDGSDDKITSRTRTTILGTFNETFSGVEVIDWLTENVDGFGGERARAVEAGSQLLRWNLISRIGVQRGWDPSASAYYVLKENATDTSPYAVEALRNQLKAEEAPAAPATDQAKAVLSVASSVMRNYLGSNAGAVTEEPPLVIARREAKIADEEYRAAVEQLDLIRLRLEETIERGLRQWEKWERERLNAAKTVMRQYESTVGRLTAKLADYGSSVKLAIDAYQPDADLNAMIESERTGDFQPRAHVYESYDTLDTSSCFGVDLRKWSGQQSWKSVVVKAGDSKASATIPPVLTALLRAIETKQGSVADDEKRKAWIYVVGLKEQHQLRNRINDSLLPVDAMVAEIQPFNLPVMAAAVKLWLLELNPPLLGAETYAMCKEAYAKAVATDDLPHLLSQMAGAQIFVLDAIIGHLRRLIDATTTEETNEVYITKLGLSLGRAIMRPDGDVGLKDHTASRLVSDLITHYIDVFPELLQKARRVVERPMPVRKRTRPVDERMIRSKLQQDYDDDQSSSARRSVDASSESANRTERLPEDMVPESKAKELAQEPLKDTRPRSAASEEEQPPAFAAPKLDASLQAPVAAAPKPVEETPPVFEPPKLDSAPTTTLGAPVVDQKTSDDDNYDDNDRPPAFAPPKIGSDSSKTEYAVLEQPPVSDATAKDDRPLQDGVASVQRSGSGETTGRLVRGPRVPAARGPRPVPGRSTGGGGANSPSSAIPPGSSIKDRIANLEKRNSGTY